MSLNHSDCLNFCGIDAAKGICRFTKEFINIDSDTCPKFKLAPKCNNCKHFSDEDEKGMGNCAGLENEHWTFGSLNAITCKGHKFR